MVFTPVTMGGDSKLVNLKVLGRRFIPPREVSDDFYRALLRWSTNC